jgi:hypothetical protein
MMRKPLRLVVQIVQPKQSGTNQTINHTNWKKLTSFTLGTGLAISEALPFIDNSYNGILHSIKQIKQEIDKT